MDTTVLMIVTQALVVALCTFGLSILVRSIRNLRGPTTNPVGSIALVLIAFSCTSFVLLLATKYPVSVTNKLLRMLDPTVEPLERPLLQLDLRPLSMEGGIAIIVGIAVGLALASLTFYVASRVERIFPYLALPLLTTGVFVGLGGAGALVVLNGAPGLDADRNGRSTVRVPPGFSVQSLVTKLNRPTVVRFGPAERLYVGVHTVVGSAGEAGDDFLGEIVSFAMVDGKARDRRVFASGLGLITGMARRGDELYISHASISAQNGEIVALRDTNGDGRADSSRLIVGGLIAGHYLWHHNQQIAFGPDERLYLGQGGTSDHGPERELLGGTILTVNADGGDLRVFARGFRNPFGLVFTRHGELLVTDNGPDAFDSLADWTQRGVPVDEINHVTVGGHYGYPDAYGFPPPPSRTRPPIGIWPPHHAPAGITMYTSDKFPDAYRQNAFVALFLPGEVHRVILHRDHAGVIKWAELRKFASGLGLPADVTLADDGSLIVTEFGRGTVLAIRFAE